MTAVNRKLPGASSCKQLAGLKFFPHARTGSPNGMKYMQLGNKSEKTPKVRVLTGLTQARPRSQQYARPECAKGRECPGLLHGDQVRSRPISRVLSWTVIPLGASSPIRSSNLPGPDAGRAMRSLFGLAPSGVCHAGPLPDSRCALAAPFHPCLILMPFSGRKAIGGLLSVALSVGSRRPGVTWHSALWSPDFPRCAQGAPRLSGRLRVLILPAGANLRG